jgi:hypothetical protein
MPLFKTTTEVRKYLLVDENMQFATLLTYIKEAEDKFIKGLLGELYPVLLADYTDHTDAEGNNVDMNNDNLALLPFVQRALAYYTGYQSVTHVGVSLGEAGIQEQFGANSRPAPRWKTRELKLDYINQADQWADDLLEFLEENATSSKYNDWYSDADANTAMQGYIVYKTAIASQYVDINDSRRVFLRMKKRIREIEQNEVKRLLCADQYEEIVQQIKTGSLTPANTALINLLQPYISKKALWLTIPSIRVSVTDEGVTIHSTNDSVVQKASAQEKEVNNLLNSLKAGDYGYEADWDKVDQFIVDNIASYPLIEASPCYTSKSKSIPRYQVDNDPCNKHFSV